MHLLTHYKWWCGSGGRYATRTSCGKTIYLHREILCAAPGEFVDHINRDKLDNRRANLRIATRSQNNINRLTTMPHGFRGVEKHGRKYRATITVNNRSIRSKVKATAIEAAAEYDQLAIQHQGGFAILNFPVEAERRLPVREAAQ